MAFTKILGPGIHTLANFHSHNINSSGIITATKFVGDMEPGGGTGSFDSLTVIGNLGVGGTVTYTDVTNVDAVGIITAQSGIYIGAGATVGSFNTTTGISSFKTLNVYDSSTFDASVGIADSIFHIGDTHTAIRFPGNDIFSVEAGGNEHLRVDTTGTRITDKLLHFGDPDTMIRFPEANTFTVETGGTERLRITSSGRVGIGTTNPNAPINVQSSDNTLGILTSTNNGANLDLYDDDTQSRIRTVDGRLHLVADYNNSIADSEIRFFVDNDHKISINSDGHLIPETAGAVNIGSATAEIGDVYLADDKRLFFGSDQDFSIKHSGTNAFIDNDTGNLNIQSDATYISNKSGGSIFAEFFDGGACRLRYAGGLKFETTGIGVSVHGEVAATQDYPNFRPTLDLNFAAEKKLDPRITYQRTGPASFTNEFGIVVLVGDNVPRFDHDPVTRECKGLLIEESRTNIFASSDAGNSVWTVDNSMTKGANTTDTKDPAGTYTACKLMSVASAGSSSQIYDQTSHGSGGVVSAWAKKGTHNVLGIYDFSGGAGGIRAWFDLNTGEHRCEGGSKVAAGVQSSGDDSNTTDMIEYPNGWYRCIYYEAANMTYAFFRICDFDSDTEASASSNSIYLWGLQAEGSGVTFATSHIPCNTETMPGTVTRGADQTYIDGDDFLDFYNQTEGTVISSHSILPNIPSNHNLYTYQISPTGATAYAPLRILDKNSSIANSIAVASVYNNGYSFLTTDTGNPVTVAGRKYVIAASIKKDDYDAVFDGGDLLSDSSGDLYTADHISIGYYKPSPQAYLNGHIQRLIYYPTKLTNNQLKTITS